MKSDIANLFLEDTTDPLLIDYGEPIGAKPKGEKRSKRVRSTGFLFTKFPHEWRDRLAERRASGCAYRVALYLIDWALRQPAGQPLELKLNQERRADLEAFGVGKTGRASALRELEEAGLVSIAREPRKTLKLTVRRLE